MVKVSVPYEFREYAKAVQSLELQLISELAILLQHPPNRRSASKARVTGLLRQLNSNAATANKLIDRKVAVTVRAVINSLRGKHPQLTNQEFRGANKFLPLALRASAQIDVLASTIAQSTTYTALARKLGLTAMHSSSFEATMRNRILESLKTPLRLMTKARVIRKFQLSYYLLLTAQAEHARALTSAKIEIATAADLDLVKVSSNPSTIGDYCDAYAGCVFSLFGNTPGIPLLADTPNGGPPFHPWCYHSIDIIDHDDLSQSEIASLKIADRKFLLRDHKDTSKRIAQDWWEAQAQNET